jgi:hypothetical protein
MRAIIPSSDLLVFLSAIQGPTAENVVILHGCETWSLTLREEYRLRVSENKVLTIFGPMRD